MNRIINHPFTALILTIIGVVFITSLNKTQQRNKQVTATAQIMESKVGTLRQEVTQAQQKLESSQSQEDFKKQQIIRDELLMQKEDETVVQLPFITPIETNRPDSAMINQSPWQEWRELFFGDKK